MDPALNMAAEAANDDEEAFRVAPSNLEAEQALLGAILVNNEACDRVTGFLLPAGDEAVAAERTAQFAAAVGWWPVKLALLGVLALSLVHCGHRIRHTMMDLGMRRYSSLLKVPCYGGALAGTIWAAMLLWGI